MNIINQTFNWIERLTPRTKTNYIILHHRAGDGDINSLHQDHINRGWLGVGYHFYVRKDGRIYCGRPVEMVGAHCTNINNVSVGVCFEGNFENETMNSKQIKAGKELVDYLKTLYPNATIESHSDLAQTACPGKHFPFHEIKRGVDAMTVAKAIKIIKNKVGLSSETITFLLCYKYGDELVIKIAKALEEGK